ncbi:LacI family DNA-binding transcriptional regulator [Microbacterium sp. NC79]|uniref:LacI family DNA-binding transcriptional regulator n=1 Tax=Microbacterium sp. NC79 TaxID=2851009 RepID=UPI001C2BD3D7|nr:LacI family DNA-binding transcriptional regulator [Microbacterium sp. NC79]MBV0895916.1 LacI family transcriptional regulator [Microbacterium sp. NC79]
MTTPATSAVTIEEVAAAAGVSRSTVSRVVNGSTAVSPAAIDAVNKAIADLKYVPNRAARTLASRTTNALALVVPEDPTRFFGDPYFASVVGGIYSRLASTPYVLNVFLASDDQGDKTTAYLRGGNIDGAMIVSHHARDSFIERIADSVPVVFAGRPSQPEVAARSYYVDVDNVLGGRLGTQELIDAGRTRLATIAGPADMPPGVDRLIGFEGALADAGLEPAAVVAADFSEQGGADAMRELLASGTQVDGVFVANDLMARGAMAVLADAGLRVPDDVAVVGFDDSVIAARTSPQLSTVSQPTFTQGELMVDVLLRLLSGGAPERVTIVEPQMVARDSVG